MLIRTILAALIAAFLTAGHANADPVKIGALSLTGLWTRATPPKAPTAGGFLTIDNSGAEADRLIGVTSPIADRVEIHAMAMGDGTMIMRPTKGGIEIPAGATVALAPGGIHIMFIDVKEQLVEGGEVPVRLTFEKAGSIDTFLQVLSIGARGPAGDRPHDGDEHGAGMHGAAQ